MLGYVMLGTNDIGKARAFYDAGLGPLGAKPYAAYSSDSRTFYTVGEGQPMFAIGKPLDGGKANFGNGSMVAFPAKTRALVDAAYAKAMALGGKDEGKPGIRGSDQNGFYGAYMRDPDGNKLCIFRLGPP
jgi:catechol 2,3-dioxygenase-like lactoylglutathione lyase family enzyme